jgi:hypothetical protein
MSLVDYLTPVDRKLLDEEMEKASSLLSAIIRVCDWKGFAVLFSSVQEGLLWVEEHRDKTTSCYVNVSSLFKLIDYIRGVLLDRGYKMEKYNWENTKYRAIRSWLIEPKERLTEFYVLLLDVLNATDEIKREFEKFKGKLLKIDELSSNFRMERGALGTFLLYKGFVCSRVFFSHSSSGWFNLTHDKSQSPQEYMREQEERKNLLSEI